MELVCIGVGGSGAACLEVVLHMASIGLFPPECKIVPMALDPDRGHPRIDGLTRFLTAYESLRHAGSAARLSADGLFGTSMISATSLNAAKPAAHESLFTVLGLADQRRRALARLFFTDSELGTADSREFANGYYGRANAGVCFFCDPDGRNQFLELLRQHLPEGDAQVIVMGSAFGGTGAAGMLHVARTLRNDEELTRREIPIGLVHLEPYFEPDASSAGRTQGLLNLPATFQRRTGAAYQFLGHLAQNNNLPLDVIYALGAPISTVFPPEWFNRDQQDNPHLWIEYLAALAVRDFVVNRPKGRRRDVRLRRVAEGPIFGEPLVILQRTLLSALATYALLDRLVLPLVARRAGAQAGHPWIHDVLTEGDLTPQALDEHLRYSQELLQVVLGHAGILDANWRADARDSDAGRQRHAQMTLKTRASFPPDFLSYMERLNLSELLRAGDPFTLFDSYTRKDDAALPVRALHRWAAAALPPASRAVPPAQARQYQLVQQETQETGAQPMNLANIPDDTFAMKTGRDADEVLRKLARAPWKSPGGSAGPQTAEYPSIWAPALVHRDLLFGSQNGHDGGRYVHFGLLYLALMPYRELIEPPVYAFPLRHPALKAVIHSTFPLADYQRTLSPDGTVLALFLRDTPLFQDSPAPDEVVGFFYPDTLIVPAAGLAAKQEVVLRELGKYAIGGGLPQIVARLCGPDWHEVLKNEQIPDADARGSRLARYLASFPDGQLAPLDASQRYRRFPYKAPGWLEHLYEPQELA